jgi:hypothetical protein
MRRRQHTFTFTHTKNHHGGGKYCTGAVQKGDMLIVSLKFMACKRSQSDLRVLACPLSLVLVCRKLEKIGVFSTVGEPHFDRTPS